MMRKKRQYSAFINRIGIGISLCLCLILALPPESTAQSSDTRTVQITWPAGDRNNNGFTSASISMRYQFRNCFGEVSIIYLLDSNSLNTSNQYWFNGEIRTVPNDRLPENRSSISFSGRVTAPGGRNVGQFRDDYAGSLAGFGCFGQQSRVAYFRDTAPNADTEELREQFLRSLSLSANRPDGPLSQREVEAYFNRIDREERQRIQQEERERARAEREAELERQREERERQAAEREREREREREARAGVGGTGAGAGAAGTGSTGRSPRSGSDDDSDTSTEATSSEDTSDAFDRARAEAQVAEAQAAADRQQVRSRQSAEITGAAIFLHFFIGRIIYSDIGREIPESHYVTPGPAVIFNVGYGLSSVPTFYNRNMNGEERTTNHASTTFDLGLMLEFYPYFSKNMGYKFDLNFHVGHGLLIQDFSFTAGGGLHGYLG
ncbi:MAG: hypothetical protein LAT57_11940, partial [Balneolales bacterium]|nr:hypothetical protein [Balneolales bacterium]